MILKFGSVVLALMLSLMIISLAFGQLEPKADFEAEMMKQKIFHLFSQLSDEQKEILKFHLKKQAIYRSRHSCPKTKLTDDDYYLWLQEQAE